jgi:hypothetical protein
MPNCDLFPLKNIIRLFSEVVLKNESVKGSRDFEGGVNVSSLMYSL